MDGHKDKLCDLVIDFYFLNYLWINLAQVLLRNDDQWGKELFVILTTTF